MNGMRHMQAARFCLGLLKRKVDAETVSRLALAYDQAATFARRRGKAYRRHANKAKAAIGRALALKEDPEFLHIRGIIRLHDEKPAQALSDFQRAYRRTHDPKYLVSIGNAQRQRGDRTAALRSYQRAKRHRTLDGGLLDFNIAQILFEMGRPVQAKKIAKAGLSRTPKNAFQKELRRQFKRLLDKVDE